MTSPSSTFAAPVTGASQGSTPLRGKVAVVTGAASGIGKAIAQTLAAAGAMVAVADLNLEGAKAAAEEIVAGGGLAVGLAMDVSDEAAVDAAIDGLAVEFGSIDILVSNAGIQIVSGIDTLSYADWKKVLAIHLDGAFLTTRAALRHMYRPRTTDGGQSAASQGAANGHANGAVATGVSHLSGGVAAAPVPANPAGEARSRGGVVIYMGSSHSHLASPLKSAYVTAKHGLLGLARTLAKEGAKHQVRSHVVCPGFVRTPLVEKQIPEQARALGISEESVVRDVMLAGTVDATFTTLDDVAQTVLFLASFPSAALTGQSIMVSHGWYMQ